jgi:predicted transcriptional regulator
VRQKPTIGQAELELLRYVADHHPITVRAVAEHLAETKGLARTTALTVMERLRKKGFLTRRKASGAYEYSPSVPKADLQQTLIGDFVERALGGSLGPFVAYLASGGRLSSEEFDELKRLVADLEAQRGEAER